MRKTTNMILTVLLASGFAAGCAAEIGENEGPGDNEKGDLGGGALSQRLGVVIDDLFRDKMSWLLLVEMDAEYVFEGVDQKQTVKGTARTCQFGIDGLGRVGPQEIDLPPIQFEHEMWRTAKGQYGVAFETTALSQADTSRNLSSQLGSLFASVLPEETELRDFSMVLGSEPGETESQILFIDHGRHASVNAPFWFGSVLVTEREFELDPIAAGAPFLDVGEGIAIEVFELGEGDVDFANCQELVDALGV
jgi:hypothetical protein